MLWGAIAGLAGGIVDGVMMRVVDMMLSIPFLFAILILASRYSSSVLTLVLADHRQLLLAGARAAGPRRGAHAPGQRLRVGGQGSGRVPAPDGAHRHLIPNALSVVVVNITFQVADAILLVAALGFLGFGLNFPVFDWGDMLSNGVRLPAERLATGG